MFPVKASANLFRMPFYWLKVGKTDVRDKFLQIFLKVLSARYDRRMDFVLNPIDYYNY